jgi:hypothetical protein
MENDDNENNIINLKKHEEIYFMNLTFKKVLRLGVVAILSVLLLVGLFFHFYAGSKHYSLFGPRPDFEILNVVIDTNEKYIILLSVITLINILMVFVNKVVISAIKMTVNNPHITEIYGISKISLEMYINVILAADTFIDMLSMYVSIAKLDILIFCGIMKVICIFIMNRCLLYNKRCIP